MIKKPKYMKRVFSGKDVPVIGLDQGKSELYRGDGVNFLMNVFFNTTLSVREGQVESIIYDDTIHNADRLSKNAFICEGTNIWVSVI